MPTVLCQAISLQQEIPTLLIQISSIQEIKCFPNVILQIGKQLTVRGLHYKMPS